MFGPIRTVCSEDDKDDESFAGLESLFPVGRLQGLSLHLAGQRSLVPHKIGSFWATTQESMQGL